MRALITGATNGIGAVVADRLASAGHDLTVVGRNRDKLAATAGRLRASASTIAVETELTDLADLEQVHALAQHLGAGAPFDVVISNAALIAPVDERNGAGIPRSVVANYLAPYVLLRGLAEAHRDHPARFVIVGADPAYLAASPIDPDDLGYTDPEVLGDDPDLRPFALYARTKTMDHMLMYALARRLEDSPITVVGAHPGIIGQTGLSGEVPGLDEKVHRAYGIDTETMPPPTAGAENPLWVATAPEVEGATGTYYVDRAAALDAPHITDVRCGDRLWDASARLVGLSPQLTTR
jgi:NAD(P)-dependent dehydrogenase (short-subunit alcohol dehydrogenase family)